MQTDRELLELAAKAAGIRGEYMQRLTGDGFAIPGCVVHLWNPLTDDGDALRLAVKLKIDLKLYDDHVVAWFDGGYIGTGKILYGDDPQAATRRAIVRAAAETGVQAHPDNKDGGAVYG
ncbi:hypothetical protein [Achromobacter aegrifaciens]|uniref:hypothetical protein n=1 Tax=Achromobacter aegrifaciens TaxID=1287736 RepID=UPI0028A925F2|nr:hypothetical protein [Achromobacter aegrifaciens]